MFEPQRRVGCRRTRRENEANAVLSVTRCFTTVSERVEVFASGSCRLTKSARARSHAARSGIHAEARRWSTSPPHHLTTSPPHHAERNTRTRQRRAALYPEYFVYSSTEASSHLLQDLPRDSFIASCTSQISRCTLRCSRGSTSLVPASSSVCEFVLVTDHNSLS